MKKNIKLLLFTFLLSACSMVDVMDKVPPYEADLEGAITNSNTVELALTGVYSNLPSSGYNSQYTIASGSFKAGLMTKPSWWTKGNAIYYYERYWPTLGGTRDYDWGYDYELIKNANFLLGAIEKINDFTENRKDEIIGELHFLRAIAYVRLMVRYTQHWDINSPLGLIIRDESPSLGTVLKDRSTVAESYQMILDELEIAIENCPDYSSCWQASKVAAKAYKTRVLLMMGNYTECITAANEVLTHTENSLSSDYASIFNDYSNTKEILFGRVYGTSEVTDVESGRTSFSSGKWGPSANFLELLGNDPRYQDIIGDEIEIDYRYGIGGQVYKNHTVKKLYNSSNDLPIIYMRTAEIYLLKAEAIYRSGGSYEDAYAAIAMIRNRAGADTVPHATTEEIEDAICNEWLIEMSFENWHEYLALRRFGVEKLLERNDFLKAALDKAILAGADSEAQYRQRIVDFRILPIPSNETNGNPAAQNPGY
jgi:hypothetical protein